MIQRIQTIFLLGAVIFLVMMLFLPLAEIQADGGVTYTGMSRGLRLESGEYAFSTWPVFILVLVTAALLFINIFLYRNRKLQIRICVYAIVLGFGLMGLIYYYWVLIFRQLVIENFWIRVPVIFPVAAIILTYLAFRGIRKDEILIRSIDKIR